MGLLVIAQGALFISMAFAVLGWAQRVDQHAEQLNEPDAPGHDAEALNALVYPLDSDTDYEALMEIIGDARVVLIGEASHGTQEFYQMRADITRRLIEEKGFEAVAVEADWHAAERVNRFVRAQSDDASAGEALREFERFPVWMWRNTVVHEFVTWLRAYNVEQREDAQVGFYGLDLYGMYESMAAVIAALERVDAEAAERARERYACFEEFDSPETYAYSVGRVGSTCQAQVSEQLEDIRTHRTQYAELMSPEDLLSLERNAQVVVDAERYYHASFASGVSTWNLRDMHMADTVTALLSHLQAQNGDGKIVLWAHNSHIGDARATEMGARGELNLGQLMREQHAEDAVLVGFSTYTGTVTAAHDWGDLPQVMDVNPGLPESYEALFHAVDAPDFLVVLEDNQVEEVLDETRLQRAIGVIYRPQTERASHYFGADLPNQFDALIHLDETTALEPLDPLPTWESEAGNSAAP